VRAGGDEAAGDHEPQAHDHHAPVAEALTEHAAGQREHGAGQHVEADQRADLHPGELELREHEGRHRRDGLELKTHRRARDEHDGQRHPAVRHGRGS
jgi:hypothetical protein